jgi:DNA-binding NarL/FixJ family response regulator
MTAARILVADDHEVVRRGVKEILETQPGWEVCGEAVDGHEVIEKARGLKPDVVVLDISMPGLNGLEATRRLLKEVPQTEVLILTIHGSEQLMHEVLAAGARGYLLKSDAGRDLVSAVDSLLRHKPFFTAKLSELVLESYLDPDTTTGQDVPPYRDLTGREREILQLLAEGKGAKEIGTLLGISPKTAETHRANILHKLGLKSTADLIRYAVRNKIIQP